MSRIRVIHSIPLWLGQTLTWLYHQIQCLDRSIDAHVVCEHTAHLEQFGIRYIHSTADLPIRFQYWDRLLRRLGLRKQVGRLAQIGQELKPSVVHSHFGNIGWTNLSAVQRLGVPHIVTFYGRDVNLLPTQDPRWKDRYHDLFRQADLFFCEGPHMASCLRRLGCPAHKIHVQRLGVMLEDLPFQPRQWDGKEPLRVLMAASFREKKGIPYGLEALGKLPATVPLEVTLIGDAPPEDAVSLEKVRILKTIERSGLSGKVRLMGFQPHAVVLREAYRHHLFLSPSVTASDGDTEGGAPVTLIEMAATGMPIVTTRHCDIPEILLDGRSTWLAEERDVEGLETALQRWIEQPRQWTDMLRMGRDHIEQHFDARMQGKRLTQHYSDICQLSS